MKVHLILLVLLSLATLQIRSETLTKKEGFWLTGKSLWAGGEKVTTAGDINGDGYDDMIFTSFRSAYVIFGGPTVSLNDIDVEHLTPEQGFEIGKMPIESVGSVDINKDGYSDILICAVYGRYNSNNKMAIYIIYGGKNMPKGMLDPRNLTITQGFNITLGENMPYSVRSAGDVNGDGYPDMIIGPYYLQERRSPKLKHYVIYGGPNHESFHIKNITRDQAWEITSNNVTDYLHIREARGAGDVNGDGYDDILIAVRSREKKSEGFVSIIYGGKSLKTLNIATMTNKQGFNITSSSINFTFPATATSAGDFNKDGFADILIEDSNGLNSSALIVYGGKYLENINCTKLTNQHGIRISGFYSDGYQTGRVSSAGDFNKDGYADVIVPGPRLDSNLKKNTSSDYIVFGSASPVSSDLISLSSHQSLKFEYDIDWEAPGTHTVAFAGDINNDGYDDVVIYVRRKIAAYVMLGRPNN